MAKLEAMTFVGIPFYSLAKYRGMGSAVQSLRDAGIVQRQVPERSRSGISVMLSVLG